MTRAGEAPRANIPAGEPRAAIAGRYAVLKLLKQGQGVETVLATDLEQGVEVIVKTTQAGTMTSQARLRLEHAADVLRTIQSPYLTPFLHLGHEKDLLYLVLPYVPGITLEDRLRQGPLSVGETLTVGCCLLAALRDAHDHGILHRDVKPGNLIVDDGSPLGRATLIDFGLARTDRLDASIRDVPVGTALYMSPEQAGMLHQGVDERSDLYSAGSLLFECVAGRPPFAGDSVREVLSQHLTLRPPPLRSLGVEAPRALDEVIQRLLRKDPRERYQSAEAVRVDLRALAEAWAAGVTEPALVVGLYDRRRTLTEPAFVGRDAELAALDDLFRQARQGQGGLVLLEAESGGGKTRLLQELAQRSARQGAWVLRGQGVDQGAQRPFQLFVGVAQEFLAAARADGKLGARMAAGLGDQGEAVCDVFPELAEILGRGAAAGLGPEAFGEIRSLRALATFFDALGTEERPALVLLDDCQWAAELTLKFLRYWHARPERPERARPPILIVAAFRSEEVGPEHPLRAVTPRTHLSLSPLRAEQVRRLAESMAGQLPAEVLPVLERLVQGSPFMGTAVLRGLVETGALVGAPEGWQVDRPALAEVQASRQAAAFLNRRLQLLPAATRGLLLAGAVIGKEFDLEFAAALACQALPEASAAVTEARRRHILWNLGADGQYSFAHDKLREGLLALLAADERRALHAQAALRLEASACQRAFELAYHFDAAGQHERALPYALAAARQARAQHGLEVAERQYRIAERGASAAPAATQLELAEGLGDVLMLRGRYDEAQRQFEKGRALAQGAVAQAEIEGKLGELAFKRGDVTTACRAIERGLRLLGRWAPRHRLTFLLATGWEVFRQVLHTLWPGLFLGWRRREGADAQFLAFRLFSRLAYAYWFSRGKVPCAWAHLREMNLAELYPPSPELAQAYSEHAPVMTMVPYFSRGIAYAEKSLALRRDFGDIWGEGQSLHFYGVALYAASRFTECIEKCRAAVRIMERSGDRWEVNTAQWHIAYCLYRQGDLAGAIELSQRVHRTGLEIGDHQATGISLAVWAKASGGRVPASLIRAELERPDEDVHTRVEVLVADGLRLLREDRPFEAVEQLEAADRLVRAHGLQQEYVAPVLPWLTTALRQAAEKAPIWGPAWRATLLRRAGRAARHGLRLARKYQNNLPHALRESALLAALSGQPRLARRCFAESLAVAGRQGARYEEAETLAAQGHVGTALGWPRADRSLEAGRRALGDFEASRDKALGAAGAAAREPEPAPPVTLALVDRFDMVLEAGRRLASALSRQNVFDAVSDAALNLLRGEQCVVLLVEPGAQERKITMLSGESAAKFSRTMAQQALAEGRPVLFAEEVSAPASESIILAGVRSALYAPIFVRGQPIACFGVTHRHLGGLFGDDERRLAEFIATLAGAALENTEGFAKIQALNQSLSQRAEELAQADRRKNDFLALLGHELRNPLAPIRNALYALRQAPADAAMRTWAESMIGRQVEQMSRLIDDLMDLSRITRGKIELRKEAVDLRTVANSAVEAAAPLIKERRHELTIAIPTGAVMLHADSVRLQQVVINLLINAAKYTEASGRIWLTVATTDAEALVRVRDTGLGIEPDQLERIFEPFMQIGRSRSSAVQWGLGIGLTLVRSIVELHGGAVRATSEGAGRGSEFVVRLPLPAETRPVEAATKPPVRPAAVASPCRRPLRILVVDDNADAVDSLAWSLSAHGHEVFKALDGLGGVATAQNCKPDVVLLDIGMPGIDGYEAARRLRAQEGFASTRLIAITGFGQEDDRQRSRDAGFDDHLVKPVDPDRLNELLELIR